MRSVKVLYKNVDGAHFFMSGDTETRGLCVAHKNLEVAFAEVAPALSILFKENYDEDVTFVPEMSFQSFRKWVEHRSDEALMAPVPGLAGVVPWMTEAVAA